MKQKNILPVLFVVLIFTACENEIPFNIKNNPPKLVLNAFIDSNQEVNQIALALTGRESVSIDFEAIVNIYIDGELKEQLNELKPDQNQYEDLYGRKVKIYRTQLKFPPGSMVKIEAKTTDDKYHAWAEDIVPYPIEIEHVDTTTYIEKSSWGSHTSIDKYVRIKTTFTDNPHEKNYYQIAVDSRDSIWGKFYPSEKDSFMIAYYGHQLNIREDIVLNEGKIPADDNSIINSSENKCNIFDDSRLNGSYTMTVSINLMNGRYIYYPGTEGVGMKLFVYLTVMTEDQYYYFRALNLYNSDNYNDVLTQPISFPSNVTGGLGTVGFSTNYRQTLEFPDYIVDENNRWY